MFRSWQYPVCSVPYIPLSLLSEQNLYLKNSEKKNGVCTEPVLPLFGILFFFPIKNPILFIVINGICYLGASGFQVLIWAMVNDAIDYQELTTGDRKEGMVYATYSFFRKLASAVSSSLSSFTLALIGYNVNEAVQTAAVKAHIWKSYTAIYAIGYLIAVLILYFVYPLSKKKTEEMLETLAKKRAKQGE